MRGSLGAGVFTQPGPKGDINAALGGRTTLREKLIKIGAKVVRHGRYITFQMAEVAIPGTLFVEILRLIDGLRPAPLPP